MLLMYFTYLFIYVRAVRYSVPATSSWCCSRPTTHGDSWDNQMDGLTVWLHRNVVADRPPAVCLWSQCLWCCIVMCRRRLFDFRFLRGLHYETVRTRFGSVMRVSGAVMRIIFRLMSRRNDDLERTESARTHYGLCVVGRSTSVSVVSGFTSHHSTTEWRAP